LPELGAGSVLLAADGADVLVGLDLRIARLRPDGTLTTLGTIPNGVGGTF